DAVLVTDRNGRVTLINPAAERLTGWTEQDACGRPVTEVFRAIDPATRMRDERAPVSDASTAREHVLIRRDGIEHPIEHMQALDALDRSARAQAMLLDDLLDMSHIVRGTLRLDLRPTDLRDVLKSAMETVQPAIMSKSIDLRLDVPANIPFVHADADRLRQVL